MPTKQPSVLTLLKGYFNVMTDKEEEEKTIESITSGIHFRGAQLWVLIFAILIASLGLNVNSTSVIIGAMLISPLMGPIIGMGFAVGINDLSLLKTAFKNFAVATVISIATATLYFLLTPFDEAQSELLARTSPTLYDVLIAFCGGAAGFIALSTRGKGNVIPGVAIATALMPPLCTAGYGIAQGNFYFFLGAFYLFFINTVFICIATVIGTRAMKFQRKQQTDVKTQRRVHRWIGGIAIITMIPATLMTINIVRQSIFKNQVDRFIKNECNIKGTQIITNQVNPTTHTLRLVAVGKEIPGSTIKALQQKLSQYRLGDYHLQVIQGSQSDSVMLINNQLSQINDRSSDRIQTLQMQQGKISDLESQLQAYTRFEQLTPQIKKETETLYPGISSLGIAPMVQNRGDSTLLRYVLVLVGMKKQHYLHPATRESLRKWLQERLQADSLRLVTTVE